MSRRAFNNLLGTEVFWSSFTDIEHTTGNCNGWLQVAHLTVSQELIKGALEFANIALNIGCQVVHHIIFQLDAVLLKNPGVVSKKIGGLDGYFVNDRMFACISGNGVGLRLPVAMARELQFSRENVTSFQPGGVTSTKEWIQIDRADAAEYEKDLELFQAALDFVKGSR